jgi:predicted RNase H-like nuclease
LRVLGIDGCRGGWFRVALTLPGLRTDCALLADTTALLQDVRAADLALIDIPIGLPPGREPRECDRAARALLGRPRAASVFPVPARATLSAPDYASANRINREHTGRGLSRQAWNIAGRIAAIDAALREDPALAGRLLESHPEVCFASLNGGTAMQHYKATRAGAAERRLLLAGMLPAMEHLLDETIAKHPRRLLAADDILDAAVLALTATAGLGGLSRLPGAPPRDACGLPMQMVHSATGAVSPPG